MKRSLKNKKVLITCGPTWVPIDTMRVISNLSSGTLGQVIAGDFAQAGAKVTLLEGPVAQPMKSKSIKILKFLFFDELAALIKGELKKKYDVCIHTAAVSDYKVKKPKKTKLSSQLRNLRLDLVPTEKIVHLIKKCNPGLFLVTFKLEAKTTKASAINMSRSLFQKGKSDLVVANSLQEQRYSGYILDKHSKFLAHKQSRGELSKTLVRIVGEHV
ncbi:MAG: hypothetical protein KAS66_04535 [Candidatus Omnitrophica bacterium]|nr:hypothetical protein [Candidatus Omnitrophota bacterium]